MNKYIPILEKKDLIYGENGVLDFAKNIGDGKLTRIYFEISKVVIVALTYNPEIAETCPKLEDGKSVDAIQLYDLLMENNMQGWNRLMTNLDVVNFIELCDKIYEEETSIMAQISNVANEMNSLIEKMPKELVRKSING